MSDTTTREESIFDDEPNTDVEPASDEQQDDEVFNEDSGDTPKSLDKFAMKTNKKINELSQSLKDSNKLNAYFARGLKPNEIIAKDPEFAKRLSRQEEYSDLFSSSPAVTEENEDVIKEAISELVIEGKRLGLHDRKILRANPTFNRYLKGFMAAGDSVEEAANEAFRKAFPKKTSMVETSFLSSPSEETSYKKESPQEALEKMYNDPKTFPSFMRKGMKK